MKNLILSLIIILFANSANAKMTELEARKVLDEIGKDYPNLIFVAAAKAQEEMYQEQQRKAEERVKSKLKEYGAGGKVPTAGAKNGDVNIVMFSDYRCGYCRKSLSDIEQLLESDSNLTLVSRDLPILGEVSDYAARASIAFNKINPSKWWDFHKVLQRASPASKEQVIAIAKKFDVTESALKKEIESKDIDQILNKNRELGNLGNITGTPGYLVGSKILHGAVPVAEFQAAINEARKK